MTSNTPNDDLTSSFHMRTLPNTIVGLSSKEGLRRLDEARANGMAEGFFDLLAYIEPQKELTYCCLASLITVLNTLRVDPCKIWKGPFRWYDETMIADGKKLQKVKKEGVNLEDFREFVPKDKVKSKTYFACNTSEKEFRLRVRQVCSSTAQCLICNYCRTGLDQTGDGHYSPIGAYHAATDSILVCDVARYKYPPHWVSCNVMWEAMKSIDSATGTSRGYILICAIGS